MSIPLTRTVSPESSSTVSPSMMRTTTAVCSFGSAVEVGDGVGVGVGVGDFAIRYGYQRYEYDIMYVTIAL
ncbi:hypothetical protein I2485_02315, partial [Nesterenkonia sp. E16_7]|nr:hypothetical protein [Nesterenkonia sp. E16_7]